MRRMGSELLIEGMVNSRGSCDHGARQIGHTMLPCRTLDAMHGKWKVCMHWAVKIFWLLAKSVLPSPQLRGSKQMAHNLYNQSKKERNVSLECFRKIVEVGSNSLRLPCWITTVKCDILSARDCVCARVLEFTRISEFLEIELFKYSSYTMCMPRVNCFNWSEDSIQSLSIFEEYSVFGSYATLQVQVCGSNKRTLVFQNALVMMSEGAWRIKGTTCSCPDL